MLEPTNDSSWPSYHVSDLDDDLDEHESILVLVLEDEVHYVLVPSVPSNIHRASRIHIRLGDPDPYLSYALSSQSGTSPGPIVSSDLISDVDLTDPSCPVQIQIHPCPYIHLPLLAPCEKASKQSH